MGTLHPFRTIALAIMLQGIGPWCPEAQAGRAQEVSFEIGVDAVGRNRLAALDVQETFARVELVSPGCAFSGGVVAGSDLTSAEIQELAAGRSIMVRLTVDVQEPDGLRSFLTVKLDRKDLEVQVRVFRREVEEYIHLDTCGGDLSTSMLLAALSKKFNTVFDAADGKRTIRQLNKLMADRRTEVLDHLRKTSHLSRHEEEKNVLLGFAPVPSLPEVLAAGSDAIEPIRATLRFPLGGPGSPVSLNCAVVLPAAYDKEKYDLVFKCEKREVSDLQLYDFAKVGSFTVPYHGGRIQNANEVLARCEAADLLYYRHHLFVNVELRDRGDRRIVLEGSAALDPCGTAVPEVRLAAFQAKPWTPYPRAHCWVQRAKWKRKGIVTRTGIRYERP